MCLATWAHDYYNVAECHTILVFSSFNASCTTVWSRCIKMRVFCPCPQREKRPLWPCRKLWNAKQPKAGLRLSAALCWNKSFFLKVDNCFLLVSWQRSHNVRICFHSEEVHCNEQAAERKIQDLQQTLPRRQVRHWDILCCDPRSWFPWRCSQTSLSSLICRSSDHMLLWWSPFWST
jgi:hypothetical protein